MKLLITVCSIVALAACGGSSSSTTGFSSGTTAASNGPGATGTTGAVSSTHGATTSGAVSSTTSGAVSGTTSGVASSATTHGATTSGVASGTTQGAASGTTSGVAGSTTSGSSGTTSGDLGQSCDFNTTSDFDTCTADGYECSEEWTGATTGICQLPEDYGTCLPSPGCQTGGGYADGGGFGPLTCLTGIFSNASGPVDVCTYSCSGTVVCNDPSTGCFLATQNATTGFCYFNPCDVDGGTQAAPAQVFTGPFFNTCNSSATGDGQCLPYGTGTNTQAFCTQTGTAAAGAACSYFRGGPNQPCVLGQYCLASAGDAGLFGNGICMPVTQDGGAGCNPTTDVAVALSDDWGLCATACTGTSDTSCAAGMNCQAVTASTFGCLPQ